MQTNLDDSDDEGIEEIDREKVATLFRNYQGNESDLFRIKQYFENDENVDCLICIRQVKAKDKIWSCENCFCSFHLLCIQKWGNDSMNQKRIHFESQPAGFYNNEGTFIPKKEVSICWDCPQCRQSYSRDKIPRQYVCYCGRERDPPVQPFLIAHSCGENCNKLLNPVCGHRCLLLCHPGPCPPCAQIIHTKCKCKRSDVIAIRCSQQNWSCGEKCRKNLPCNHLCENMCHETCPPCKKTSFKKCSCGSHTKEINCSQETWSCQVTCSKILSCNVHFCRRKCHANGCGSCPFGMKRTCFCKKKAFTVETCEEYTMESCADTCLKPLSCGNSDHRCMLRCHKGECGPCLEMIEKSCKCGNITKEFQCSKELLCELKCKRTKNCKNHSCNRKCCIECLPCDKVCSKPLSCGKHKCLSLCHDGNCYPCTMKQKIRCRCGATSIFVLCGRSKKNKSAKCKELCKLPSKCHHEMIAHKCHYGDCLPCAQTCAEILPCAHECLAKCHDFVEVVTKDKSFVPKLPGEIAEEKISLEKIDHPPCSTKVAIRCLGGHETTLMECSVARNDVSCGRPCNRKLECGNHYCKLPCHTVQDIASNDQDENCENCNAPCTVERPKGCIHGCSKIQCHQNACKRCQVKVKARCFCGLTEVYYRCCDVHKRDLDKDEIEKLRLNYLSCGSRCIKTYSCGHQCTSNCHPGPCPEANNCKKKVRLCCECKSRRIEITCDKIRQDKIVAAPCDEHCELRKKAAQSEKQLEFERLLAIEEEKNKRELAEFAQKFGTKKKFKERKLRVFEEKKDYTYLTIAIISVFIVIIAVSVLYIIYRK